MTKKTFVYYMYVGSDMYGDTYIANFIEKQSGPIRNKIYEQYKEQFETNEIGFVVVPITSGNDRLEVLEVSLSINI